MTQYMSCIILRTNVVDLVCIVNSTSEMINSYIHSQSHCKIWELYSYGPSERKISPFVV